MRLSSANREAFSKRFKDVEDQLISSKLALAQAHAEKFDLQNEVSVSGERLDKIRQEMKLLEQQLVQTKISLAEAQVPDWNLACPISLAFTYSSCVQADNDNLKTELKKAGGGAAAQPRKSSFFGRKQG